MRMWMVPPQYMCRQHLLGEHVELHMLLGTINKGRFPGTEKQLKILDPSKLHERHDQIAKEMVRIGIHHKSPLEEFRNDYIPQEGNIDIEASWALLTNRCNKCRELQDELSSAVSRTTI